MHRPLACVLSPALGARWAHVGHADADDSLNRKVTNLMEDINAKTATTTNLTDKVGGLGVLEESIVTLLRGSSGDVFLVGTGHSTQKSAFLVRKVIDRVQPKAVMVELCSERESKLRELHALAADVGASEVGRVASFFGGLFHYSGDIMEGIERTGARLVLGDRLDSESMTELRNAVKSMGGAPAAFVRVAGAFPRLMVDLTPKLVPYYKARLAQPELASPAAALDMSIEVKYRVMVREITKVLDSVTPEIMQAMLHSRDDFMFDKIRSELAQAQQGGAAVVVVGLAHMDGIEKRWALFEGQAAVTPCDIGTFIK